MKQKQLKIGFLSFYYPHMGGSGIFATRLAEQLADKGHSIHFIGYDTDQHLESLEKKGIKLHKVKKINYPCLKSEPYVWTLANKICEIYYKEKLDLIHVHYAFPHALAAYLAREQLKQEGHELPYIVTGHGSDIHTNGKREDVNAILRLALNKSDYITYVSKSLRAYAGKELGITKKGRHITNFIDADKFSPGKTNFRERYRIPKNAFVVGHASNFAPIKQTDYFIDLAKYLKSKRKLRMIYFLMCGDGEDKKKIVKLAKKGGIDNHFIFTGKLNEKNMKSAYNAMDMFALTSHREGCPLTILEALSSEVPVVCTKFPGIKEIIKPEHGLLFNQKDIPTFAESIIFLKKNNTLRKNMGKRGREFVVKKQSVPVIVKKYHNIYLKILKRKK